MLYDLLVFLLESHNKSCPEAIAFLILVLAVGVLPAVLWIIGGALNGLLIVYVDWLTDGKSQLPFVMREDPLQFYKWIGLPIFICSFPLYIILLVGIIIGGSFLAKMVIKLNYKLKDKT